jgi:hypothetical protein
VFLLIGPRLVRLLTPGGAMAVSAAAGIIRWTVAACTTSPVILAFIQPLHGFTFALLHLAAMQVIVQVVPLRLAATAQAIYGTLCVGLATALLTLLSGLLYGTNDLVGTTGPPRSSQTVWRPPYGNINARMTGVPTSYRGRPTDNRLPPRRCCSQNSRFEPPVWVASR